jgi:hypothetical protein
VIDECRSYSFRTDRLTGAILPEPEDKNNHCIDALRYAMWSLIRNVQPGGYFSRSALLVGGEALEAAQAEGPAQHVFGVLTTTERAGTAAGLVICAHSPLYGWPLTVLGYELIEIDQAQTTEWLEAAFARIRALAAEWRAPRNVQLWVDDGALGQAVASLAMEHAVRNGMQGLLLDVCLLNQRDIDPLTVDQRAHEVRSVINGARYVKLSRSAYLQQSTFRSSTTNHLTSQLFGFRPEVRDAAQELVNALCIAISITRVPEL